MIRHALPVFLLLAASAAQAAEGNLLIAGESFSHADVLDARAQPEIDGTASIRITFDGAAAKRIETLTARLIGKAAQITIDDMTIADPIVHEPVRGGVLQLSGPWVLADAEALAKRISGKDPLPDSLEE